MLTQYLSLFAIAVGVSADAFAVTVSDVLCYPCLPKRKKISLPIIFGLFQGIMPLLGYYLGLLFAEYIEKVDHWVALALLTVLGVKMILESVKENAKEKKKEECGCLDIQEDTKHLSYKVILVQAVATSIDALAVGITLAVAVNLSVFISVGLIAVITALICTVGLFVGRVGKYLKDKAGIVGGAILIAIGIKIFVEHLIGA